MTDIEHSEDQDQIRSAGEVAKRCVILHAVIAAAHNEPRSELIEWLIREGLWDYVTPKEIEFLQAIVPERQAIINAGWRMEALLPLLWALGHIEKMSDPVELCDVPTMQDASPPLFEGTSEFIAKSHLRPDKELLQANEEIYHIHWVVRDAQLNNQPVPSGYKPSVVQERHHALNWLIGYGNQDWDDVSTDT